MAQRRRAIFPTNRILWFKFLRCVPRLPRPALLRPVFALHELNATLDERLLRVGAGELELNVAIALEKIGK